jgi:hypothetical protein
MNSNGMPILLKIPCFWYLSASGKKLTLRLQPKRSLVMSYRTSKQQLAAGKDTSPAPKKRLPAYKRQRELYFSHVWLDREIYAQVLMFIGWERKRKYSIKMAVRILLELGLKHYIIEQINLAKDEQDLAKKERTRTTGAFRLR